MTKIYNKKNEKQTRRRLRRNMPKAEKLLWAKLRDRQILGFKFRRQFGVGPYSIDFYCPELKLAIETDGDSHFASEDAVEYDHRREDYIQAFGIRILRFTNNQIYRNIDDAVEYIAHYILNLNQRNSSAW